MQGEVGVGHNTTTRGQVGVGHHITNQWQGGVTGQREAGSVTLGLDSSAIQARVNGEEQAMEANLLLSDATLESPELDDVDMPSSPILPYTQPLATTSASNGNSPIAFFVLFFMFSVLIGTYAEIERNLEMKRFTAELKSTFKSRDGLSVATGTCDLYN